MATLAILVPDARAQARLSSALAPAHAVRLEATWEALASALARGDVDACVLDADHPDRARVKQRLALLKRHPDVAVVACVHSAGAGSLYGVGALGVDGVVVAATPAGSVRSEVDDALARARGRRARRLLRDRLADPGPRAVAWAVEHAGAAATVDRLASALARSPDGLRRDCRETNLPSPAKILLWGRLILAASRLHDDGRGVEEVAFSLGYAASTSLARAMKLHTGRTPVQVADSGGMDVVVEALASRNGRPG